MRYRLIDNSLNNVNDILNTVLINRGISNPEAYMHIDDTCIDDYDNIDKSVECLMNHFEIGDNISVLVDCDPDGYTSASMIYSYVKKQNPNYPVSYIIHKSNKAHGLTKMDDGDVDIPKGTKLLVIPDAGTNDSEQCNNLIDNGIDVLIIDHHEQEEIGKDNKAIVVNNQISDNYKNKAFSGAGVMYEFLKALVWACAGFECFAEINKINSKMIAHFGKDWGIRKTSFKSWARFFKLYSAFFDVCYKDEEKHTGMSVRLKENALLKI